MSYSYTKLFSSITESTVWSEPLAVRVVWITMLAMSDRYGRVWGSIPGLARRANVTMAECQQALDCFFAPDPHSRTPDNDGRRVEAIGGGWRLLNHEKYREMQDEEARLERNAERQRRFRERHKSDDVSHGTVTERNESNAGVTKVTKSNPIADADADADADAVNQKKKKKTLSGKPDPDAGFSRWYAAYPRHEARGDAEKAWRGLKPRPAVEVLLAAVEWQRRAGCLQPREADGRSLIPLPATWLRKARWLDEPPAQPAYTGVFSEERLDAGR